MDRAWDMSGEERRGEGRGGEWCWFEPLNEFTCSELCASLVVLIEHSSAVGQTNCTLGCTCTHSAFVAANCL